MLRYAIIVIGESADSDEARTSSATVMTESFDYASEAHAVIKSMIKSGCDFGKWLVVSWSWNQGVMISKAWNGNTSVALCSHFGTAGAHMLGRNVALQILSDLELDEHEQDGIPSGWMDEFVDDIMIKRADG